MKITLLLCLLTVVQGCATLGHSERELHHSAWASGNVNQDADGGGAATSFLGNVILGALIGAVGPGLLTYYLFEDEPPVGYLLSDRTNEALTAAGTGALYGAISMTVGEMGRYGAGDNELFDAAFHMTGLLGAAGTSLAPLLMEDVDTPEQVFDAMSTGVMAGMGAGFGSGVVFGTMLEGGDDGYLPPSFGSPDRGPTPGSSSAAGEQVDMSGDLWTETIPNMERYCGFPYRGSRDGVGEIVEAHQCAYAFNLECAYRKADSDAKRQAALVEWRRSCSRISALGITCPHCPARPGVGVECTGPPVL